MTITGAEIALPRSIDDVDEAWLTAVLRGSGAIGAETTVASASTARFAEGVGLLSELHRATLTYDGPAHGAPETVIVKFAIADPAQRGMAQALGFYTRELHFYANLAADMPFRSPIGHAGVADPETGDFVLVMEDLSGLRSADQRDGVSWDDALRSARAMAELHARYHEHPDLAEMAEIYPPIENPIYLAALPGVFDAGWAGVKQFAPDVLTPEIEAFGDRFGTLVPFFLGSFMSPATLLHGDWRADNLFYTDDGEVAVVDFQIMGQGTGPYDLGYFASQSIASEVRSGRDHELIEAYVAALAEAGVERDLAEVADQYRLALAHCLIYAVTSYQSYEALPERSHQLMRVMLERAVQAIIDMDALELLPPA